MALSETASTRSRHYPWAKALLKPQPEEGMLCLHLEVICSSMSILRWD